MWTGGGGHVSILKKVSDKVEDLEENSLKAANVGTPPLNPYPNRKLCLFACFLNKFAKSFRQTFLKFCNFASEFLATIIENISSFGGVWLRPQTPILADLYNNSNYSSQRAHKRKFS